MLKSNFRIIIICAISLCFSNNGRARSVVLVSYKSKENTARLIVKILEEKIHLPKVLITLRKINDPCRMQRESVVHICVTEEDAMKIIRFENEIVRRTLSRFGELYVNNKK